MSTVFFPLPSAAAVPPASTDAADVRLVVVLLSAASLILLEDCLKLGAVFPIVAEHVVVVAFCVAKLSPRRLHGDSASRDTS